ncbi:Bug family tripartite tricarboxylate transporter substrate binding protein [Paracraurococcus lichenis]|uniref:Tripartite tricarboxylate transporter substrate-binding protein n=1 Tax=Paracraurococcus lichenis TaxID=3064888 RepID=A0ABT9E9I5_9PROT|nr:tripartite tricarboxylate transporter substrate-binding protein [Paracraurococcus sp. LOR1-02]MDO9712871.1 tripartite tricarboxylate transporter substrate-binding protein [Paracraurococcus sp. LOR1-02]
MRRRDLLALAALPGSAPAATQQAWPTRSINLVIPFPPGGIVDTLGRTTAERVARVLGQPVTIENRPGAGSAIGNAQVAAARPDGYTVLSGGIGLAIIPNLQPGLAPQDPATALDPVAHTSRTAYVLHINRGLPVNSLAEFVAWARTRGPNLNAATSGLGIGVHLTWELFRRQAGLLEGEVLHYRGGVPAILDIQAGRADFAWSTALEAIQAMRAGQTRPIAVTAAQRIAALPDTPTVIESGYPGFEVQSWSGWYVPAGTPPPIIARLSAALEEALADPDLRARFTEWGVEAAYGPPAMLRETLLRETRRWGQLIREAKIEAQPG